MGAPNLSDTRLPGPRSDSSLSVSSPGFHRTKISVNTLKTPPPSIPPSELLANSFTFQCSRTRAFSSVCIWTITIPDADGQKVVVLDPLELKLLMVVSCHKNARTRNRSPASAF